LPFHHRLPNETILAHLPFHLEIHLSWPCANCTTNFDHLVFSLYQRNSFFWLFFIALFFKKIYSLFTYKSYFRFEFCGQHVQRNGILCCNIICRQCLLFYNSAKNVYEVLCFCHCSNISYHQYGTSS
jgi:hypothetical protein